MNDINKPEDYNNNPVESPNNTQPHNQNNDQAPTYYAQEQSSQQPTYNNYNNNPQQNSEGSPVEPPKTPEQIRNSWSYSPNAQNGANDFNTPPQPNPQWSYNEYKEAERVEIERKRKSGRSLAIVGGLLVSVVLIYFAALGMYYAFADNSTDMPMASGDSPAVNTSSTPTITLTDPPANSNEQAPVISDGPLETKEIIKKVKPSTVGIEVYANNSITPTNGGTGIILDESGYIVTNAHVVQDATGIAVYLDNGESYFAELIGSDSKTDLAVIKIEADGLVPATLGNSAVLEDGDYVVAIGNPGGLELGGTTTDGIVSSANRQFKTETGQTTTYIQTNAAINPGNSGGPLINEYGQIIGINTAKISDVEYEGIGFAIPINEAQPIINELISHGYVSGRSKLGITGVEVVEFVSIRDNIPQGIAIYSVDPTSQLSTQGIARNDILIGLDDMDIKSFDDVSNFLETKKPGDTVSLTLYRPQGTTGAGNEFTVTTVLLEDIEQ